MKIIIEGPDGAGKSTLADAISRKTGFPVVHLTNVDKGKMDTQFKIALSLDNVILDRYILSNMAYNFACGAQKVSADVEYACCRDMEAPNIVVMCLPGYYSCNGVVGCDGYIRYFSKLKGTRHEEFTNEEDMRKVWEYMRIAVDAMTISLHQSPMVYDLFVGLNNKDRYFCDTVDSVCRDAKVDLGKGHAHIKETAVTSPDLFHASEEVSKELNPIEDKNDILRDNTPVGEDSDAGVGIEGGDIENSRHGQDMLPERS